jgi:hypothetical protein
MTRNDCLRERSDPRHLFACAACRADIRVAAAWRALGSLDSIERPGPADERFIARALDEIRRDRARTFLRRAALVAAAALLFTFFFGTSHERARSTLVVADDSYAALASPSALDGFVPN